MKAPKGRDQFLSTVGLVMNDIRYDANIFYQLRYSHVRRVGNKIAYSLANRALDITDFVVQMEDILPSLFSVVQDDIVGFH